MLQSSISTTQPVHRKKSHPLAALASHFVVFTDNG